MPIDLFAVGLTYGLPAAAGAGTLYLTQFLRDRAGNKKIDREVKHLALEFADTLEKYAHAATSKVSDIGEHIAQKEEGWMFGIVNLPEFNRSDERWLDLDLKIADLLLRFEDTHRSYERRLDSALQFINPDDAQDEACLMGILLAAHAMELAATLRKRYGHKPYKSEGYWPKFLQEKYDEIPDERKNTAANSFRLKPRWWQRFKRADWADG